MSNSLVWWTHKPLYTTHTHTATYTHVKGIFSLDIRAHSGLHQLYYACHTQYKMYIDMSCYWFIHHFFLWFHYLCIVTATHFTTCTSFVFHLWPWLEHNQCHWLIQRGCLRCPETSLLPGCLAFISMSHTAWLYHSKLHVTAHAMSCKLQAS